MIRPYSVTIVIDGQRRVLPVIACSWYEAFLMVAEEFGVAAVAIVKPVLTGRKVAK